MTIALTAYKQVHYVTMISASASIGLHFVIQLMLGHRVLYCKAVIIHFTTIVAGCIVQHGISVQHGIFMQLQLPRQVNNVTALTNRFHTFADCSKCSSCHAVLILLLQL